MAHRNRKKKPRQKKTRKAGDVYQDTVALIVKSLAPGAKVEVGPWIDGPDGRRDQDVVVTGTHGGRLRHIVIECKDWSKRVGIEVVDALESKRRDVGADASFVCSNRGFTEPALRKAKRVGIGMVSVLEDGNHGVKVVINEVLFCRKTIFHEYGGAEWFFSDSAAAKKVPPGTGPNEMTFEGIGVDAWLADRCFRLAMVNPSDRRIVARYRFRKPLAIQFRDVELDVTGCQVIVSYTTTFYTQVVQVSATKGVYDYLNRQLTVPSGSEVFADGVKPAPEKWIPLQLTSPPGSDDDLRPGTS